MIAIFMNNLILIENIRFGIFFLLQITENIYNPLPFFFKPVCVHKYMRVQDIKNYYNYNLHNINVFNAMFGVIICNLFAWMY